jgi:hypothetical protein
LRLLRNHRFEFFMGVGQRFGDHAVAKLRQVAT